MDRGTLIRTVALGIALLNQMIVSFGLEPIPGSNESIYENLSAVVTAAIAAWSWFKNNYITYRGKQQREVLIKNGLAEE